MQPSSTTACRECSAPLTGGASFCSRDCRNSYTNRRRTRGAEIYDLFMTLRYDRPRAKIMNIWSKLCRMAAEFKRQDDEAGRQSWNDPAVTLQNRPDLEAHILNHGSRKA